ncbi:MAG TPA: hypothetical protein VFR13_09040 [Jiangellaceae bacterium]|nr:hypothetical protein [Jiangellaceae bacterium]
MEPGAGSVTLRRATQEDGRAVADVLIRSRQAAAGSIPAAIHSDAEIQEWVEVEVIAHREVWASATGSLSSKRPVDRVTRRSSPISGSSGRPHSRRVT